MSTTLEPAAAQYQSSSPIGTAVDRLRTTMAASRLSFNWFGTTKSLSNQQKATAAQSFGADAEVLSAGKKLIDIKHPAYREVTSVKNQITSYWKDETLPFPQAGLRLIRQDSVERFNDRLIRFRDELNDAVSRLDDEYAQLKSAARGRLGELFNEADYPSTLIGLFGIAWDFPSVEPPDYLQQLNPQLYQQEADRVARRFDQALEMAESAFMEELSQLIDHLTGRLTGQLDGKPKVFRDSAINNLQDFFQRFRQLNVRSNDELDQLVSTCEQVIQGRDPQTLRSNRLVRDSVAGELGQIKLDVDQLLVNRPRRNLIRKAR